MLPAFVPIPIALRLLYVGFPLLVNVLFVKVLLLNAWLINTI